MKGKCRWTESWGESRQRQVARHCQRAAPNDRAMAAEQSHLITSRVRRREIAWRIQSGVRIHESRGRAVINLLRSSINHFGAGSRPARILLMFLFPDSSSVHVQNPSQVLHATVPDDSPFSFTELKSQSPDQGHVGSSFLTGHIPLRLFFSTESF